MRRLTVVLAASAGLASATWNFGRDLGIGIPLPARETGSGNAHIAETGWTPRPTDPPGQQAALDLLRRGRRGLRERQIANTWVNDQTCGWFSESASFAFTCEKGYTCATNRLNVVGCTGSSSAPFYTVCLDYQAYQQSACVSIGTATGCCTESAWSACGTFLWAGSPQKSMYRCFPEPTIISMIDRPRAVLDALTSSTSTTSTTTSEATTAISPTSPGGTAQPGSTAGNSSSGTNLGAIVGGAVGGVAVIAIIAGLIAYLIIRKRGKKYSAVALTEPPAPAPGHPGQSVTPAPTLGPTTPQMAMAAGPRGPSGPFPPPAPGASTYPPTSPYAPSVSTATTAYDPHQSYYGPSKPPLGHVSPGQQFNAYQPPPPGQGQPYPPQQPVPQSQGQPYPQQPVPQGHVSPPQGYQPQFGAVPELDSSGGHHTGHMSELESNAMHVGHHYNPAEMGVSTPRPQ